jgi:hypothetical protein
MLALHWEADQVAKSARRQLIRLLPRPPSLHRLLVPNSDRRYSVTCSSRDRNGCFVSTLSGGGVSCDRRSLRDAGLYLASNPRPSDLDSPLRPIIRTLTLKHWQQMFRTIRCPRREKLMLSES